MNIDNLLKSITEIKEKALEKGIELKTYTLWSNEITFEEVPNEFGSPIFATYYCEEDEIKYE